jgi:NAD(P)-dependent dehydrogenase (short-subunit alcohol dehydrogenase family)
MKQSVEGRVVAITGGSQGLGLATAQAYAEAGADVVILARRTSQLEEARAKIESVAKGKVMPVVCDVSSARLYNMAKVSTMAMLSLMAKNVPNTVLS